MPLVTCRVSRSCGVTSGLGNFIFQGESVVGLTDWEQAHLGDPMKDWASALYRGVDNLLPREDLFAEWEKESGLRIDEERIHYYSVFIDAQYVSISHPMIRRIVDLDGRIEHQPRPTRDGLPVPCQHHGLKVARRLRRRTAMRAGAIE